MSDLSLRASSLNTSESPPQDAQVVGGITPSQIQMLKDLDDGDPTDYADFSDRAGSGLGWLNRDRVMKALERKGLIDDDNRLTASGRNTLSSLKGAK